MGPKIPTFLDLFVRFGEVLTAFFNSKGSNMFPYLIIFFGIVVLLLFYLRFVVGTRKLVEFPGAHVAITGGSSGIGLAVAVEVVKRGASVSILARNQTRLDEADSIIKKEIKDGSQKVVCISCDVGAEYATVESAIKQAEDELGPVDVLVNSAGASWPLAFFDTTVEDFQRIMHINVMGSMQPTKAVIQQMKRRQTGAIVFISSMAGQLGVYGYTAYGASKFALRGLAETLQAEVKPYNIHVMLAFPPDTDTPMFHSEDEIKPKECAMISATAGLFTAEQVGLGIVDDLRERKYTSYQGFDGFMVATVTAGMSHASSVTEALCQIFLMGIIRLVNLGYLWSFDRIIQKCKQEKEQVQPSKQD